MPATSHTRTGNLRSHAPVSKICCDCLNEYEVPKCNERQSRRCPDCQRVYWIERDRERATIKAEESRLNRYRLNSKHKDAYQMVVDPSDSWGYDTHLSKLEIYSLIGMGYLDLGTQFVRQDITYIIRKDNRMRKTVMVEI